MSEYTTEQLDDCKRKFAALLLDNPTKANEIVQALLQTITANGFYPNPFYVIAYANSWQFDPVVLEETKRILAEGIEKQRIQRELLSHARNNLFDAKDRLGYYRLLSDMSGWTGKDGGLTGAKNGKHQDDKLRELAEMIVCKPGEGPKREQEVDV